MSKTKTELQWTFRRLLIVGVTLVVLLPLNSLRDLKQVAIASRFAMVAVLFLVSSILFVKPSQPFDPSIKYDIFSIDNGLSPFFAYGTMAIAFCGHHSTPNFYQQLGKYLIYFFDFFFAFISFSFFVCWILTEYRLICESLSKK